MTVRNIWIYFINTICGSKKAIAQDRPGVTRQNARISVPSLGLELTDTPGILWHKFDDQTVGIKLACLGSIKDDILDVTGSLEKLGKMTGSDIENGKTTYVTLLGVEKCQQMVDELTEEAMKELESFDNNEALKEYAQYLSKRDY